MKSIVLILATVTASLFASMSGAGDKVPPEVIKRGLDAINKVQAMERQEQLRNVLGTLQADGSEPQAIDYAMAKLRGLNLPATEGVPLYLKLLERKADVVRFNSVIALGEYGKDASPAVPKLLELFNDDQTKYYVIEETALTLGKVAEPARPVVAALTRRLENPGSSQKLKWNLIDGLGLLGPGAKEALPVIRKYLSDPSTEVQWRAYRAGGHIAAAALPSLERLKDIDALDAKDPDGTSTFATLSAIQEAGPKAAFTVPVLLKALADEPPAYVRCMVLLALGRAGGQDPSAVKALLNTLSDKDKTVWQVNLEALANIDPQRETTAEVLVDALRGPNPMARYYAASALATTSPRVGKVAPALAAALKEASGATEAGQIGAYLDLARRLGAKEGADCRDVIAGLLPERSPIYQGRENEEVHQLRAYMLVTLADLGVPKKVLPFILDYLGNSDKTMRHSYAAAARAAGALGADATAAVPLLIRALEPNFRDPRLAFEKFGLHQSPSGVYTSGRIEAIRALGKMGRAAQTAVPLLTQLAASVSGPYHEEARQALKAIATSN